MEQKRSKMYIRKSVDADLKDILRIEREAFNSNKEVELVKSLLADPSAKPLLSLIAMFDDLAVGHILFTAAHISNTSYRIKTSFLSPLAILPDFQKQGWWQTSQERIRAFIKIRC